MPWYNATVGAVYVAPAATQIAPAFLKELAGKVRGGVGAGISSGHSLLSVKWKANGVCH